MKNIYYLLFIAASIYLYSCVGTSENKIVDEQLSKEDYNINKEGFYPFSVWYSGGKEPQCSQK